jgi:hypothetical protein
VAGQVGQGQAGQLTRASTSIRPFVRHYYDLYVLAGTPEVLAMLESDEYRELRQDHDRISRVHFRGHHAPPAGLRFAGSDALFPPPDLVADIERAYDAQCKLLCYGEHPTWEQVQGRLHALRDRL